MEVIKPAFPVKSNEPKEKPSGIESMLLKCKKNIRYTKLKHFDAVKLKVKLSAW